MSATFPWLSLLAVAVGSVFGGVLRWTAQLALNAQTQPFPYATLVVNCVGGLLIGGLLAWFERVPSDVLRLLLITGFCGGLTTFSSFSAESLILLQRGEWPLALVHIASHVLGALTCAGLGFYALHALLK